MSSMPTTPEQYAAERLANRSAKYRIQVARLRALAGIPEPSPAPDVAAPEPAVDEAAAGLGTQPQDVQQRAGESDRPETACSVDGCFRPTTQGICDRCREEASAEDVRAANAELVERLHANERERAHTRPEPTHEPPRHFTSADIDPERVRAAMARRTEASA